MSWISTRRACEILGVNPATLRQWTDEGKVPAYLTPGGHRRYDERALLALVERPAGDDSGLLALPLLARHDQYEQLVRRRLEAEPWFQTFDPAARHQLRLLGNTMLHLLGTYVLAESDRERDASLERAREVAREHGHTAATAGLRIEDATRAFLLFRAPVIDTIAEWAGRRATDSRRTAEVLRRVSQFMDEVLIVMVSTHAEHARPASEKTVP